MYVDQSRGVSSAETEIESLIQQMTLAEKIGQMTQVEKGSITPEDITTYFVGSVLSGGGGNPEPNTPESWAQMVRCFAEAALKTRLGIPLVYGVDAVHGHSNVVGAVIFPHNVGMGAANDTDLIRRAARVTATELLATGVHFNFAPAVSVPQDIRWGRAYEGYSEDTDTVTRLGVAYLRALQDEEPRILGSIKHFVADGGTKWGSSQTFDWLSGNWQAPGDTYSIDQGDAVIDEDTLRRIHLAPYQAAIDAGAKAVMVSFSSWQGTKMHAQRYLITDVLKGELAFDGFVISDWMAVDQIDRDYRVSVITAINAGLDMVMVPYDYKLFIQTLTEAVKAGAVPVERIDDAVRRILRVKFWLGLFDTPLGDAELLPLIGSVEHREVAREAVRKSLVLLKNEGMALPLSKSARILVAGRGADNVGMQCGGWSISWQGDHGATTSGTSILAGIRQTVTDSAQVIYDPSGTFANEKSAPVGIVVIGETPYAEGFGDDGVLRLSDEDSAVIAQVRPRCDQLIVVILSGRPLVITDELAQADAFVAAWLPGTEGQGIVDVLFGDHPFTGRLPYSWLRSADQLPFDFANLPAEGSDVPLFPRGFGLTYDDGTSI